MMKRLVKLLFLMSLLLLGAGLIVPSFIDWNRHKDKILEQLSGYFQRKIDIAGNVSLQILPQPEVMVESVTVANADGAKAPSLMTLKMLGVRIKFSPLLEGRIEVESLDLVEPVFNLEILPNGKPDWLGVMKEKSADALGGAAASVQLNQVSIVNGTFSYANPATGSKLKIENVNLSVIADTLLGPYTANGSMQYRGLPVKVDIATEKYTGTAPMPVRISFLPARDLPTVKFNGVADLQSDLDVQGELSVSDGDLASLLNADSLKSIRFLRDPVSLRSVMEFKNGQLSLSDIKAKFGPKGDLRGKVSLQFSRTGKPALHLDIEGDNLAITDKSGDSYLSVPDGFTGSLSAKGKNITLSGYKFSTAEVTADFDPKEWRMKAARLDLPGSTVVRLAGIITPSADSGTYNIQVMTDDLGKMTAALLPSEGSIFKVLSDTGIVRKLAFSSGLTVSPARISLFNIDGTLEDKIKLSGVINVDRILQKPNFVAKLNISNVDISAITPEVLGSFRQGIMKAQSDIELTFRDFARNGLKIPELSLNGKMSEGTADLFYVVKMEQLGDAVSLLPPLLPSLKNADLKGEVKVVGPNYSFSSSGTAEGSSLELRGTQAAGIHQISVHMQSGDADTALAQLGLPLARLVGDKGAFSLSGELKGTKDSYMIEQMKMKIGASEVSGSLEKKDNRLTADLVAQRIDLDKWLAGDWAVSHDATIRLKGTELTFQGQHIIDPRLTVNAGASSVHIPDLTGTLWSGSLAADLSLTRGEQGGWSSTLKGSLKQADLNVLTARLGVDGFSAGVGDIDFNLSSSVNTPLAAVGSLNVKANILKIDKFNFDKMGETIDTLTAVPTTLQQIVDNNLHQNGSVTFRDVTGRFKVDKGRITIESLPLSNSIGDVNISGSANVKANSYDVLADIALKQPPKFPVFKVQRSSGSADYSADIQPIQKFILATNPAPVVTQPDVPPAPSAAAALPPVQKNEETNGLKDVLKRLDEEPVTPAPVKPAAPQKQDTGKELQNMLMRQMMQQESGVGVIP